MAKRKPPKPPKTPECDKLAKVRDQFDAIDGFIDLLAGRGDHKNVGSIILCYQPWITDRPVYAKNRLSFDLPIGRKRLARKNWKRSEHYVPYIGIRPLIFKFFGINENKLEKERRKLLDYQRKLNAFHS